MSAKRAVLPRVAYLLAVAFAGASLFFTAGDGMETDLAALVGDVSGGGVREAASAMSRSAKFLVKADSADEARSRLEELGVALPPSGTERRLRGMLAPYARGFLSPETRALLERGEFAAVRDDAAARLFSPVPPVLPVRSDPFLLFTDYALRSESPKGGWIAVDAELAPEEAAAALAAVKDAGDVRCAGAPFHTAVAAERSKKEINVLTAVSAALTVLFGLALVRSMRFLPFLVGIVACAFCVSAAALFALPGRPHVIALVFGTTLIGMSVDYVYHSSMAERSVVKPLTVSYLSTSLCFIPLLFSGAAVLNQMAVFTVAGLTAVFAGVLAFRRPEPGRRGESEPARKEAVKEGVPRKTRIAVFGALCVLSVAYLAWRCAVTPGGADLSRFHDPDPYLAEGERIVMEMSGGAGFVPSGEEQRRSADLVRRLYAAEGTNYCRMTGLPLSILEIPDTDEVFAPRERIEETLSDWRKDADRSLFAAMLVLTAVFALMFGRSFLDFALPMFTACCCADFVLTSIGEDGNFFARICFFVFIGMGFDYAVFRRHAAMEGKGRGPSRAVLYSFLTSFTGFGLLAFTGFAITRVMGITLAVGLAVSYLAAKLTCGISGDIFRRRAGSAVGTDPAGNGELIVDSGELGAWHEQREQCASVFWARFMWYSYAWFGKNFQKLIFVIGMPVIYVFSGAGRTALKKFYAVLSEFTGNEVRPTVPRLFRHILGFAWGLMDKTDSCTLRKNPPAMSVRDDDGWRAFRQTVDSGKGAFILCTHVGMIGVLPSLPDALKRSGEEMRVPKVNAFQQMGHAAVFMKVFMEHFDGTRLELHAVEDIGVETAVRMKEAIERGELVIMAGDRVSAGSKSVLRRAFMGRDCAWPKGVYRFAGLMESPVFAVTCVCTGWNRYEVHFAALDRRPSAMLDGFVSFLESETLAYPGQWYQFYDFFGGASAG